MAQRKEIEGAGSRVHMDIAGAGVDCAVQARSGSVRIVPQSWLDDHVQHVIEQAPEHFHDVVSFPGIRARS